MILCHMTRHNLQIKGKLLKFLLTIETQLHAQTLSVSAIERPCHADSCMYVVYGGWGSRGGGAINDLSNDARLIDWLIH